MSDKKEVKVGDMVNSWNLGLPKYDGCEFKAFAGSSKVQITKVPERKPEIPDEPKTRGAVVTIEGDDYFIAVRFTDADDLPFPFIAAYSANGVGDYDDSNFADWRYIVLRASGRKIIVHKMVDLDEAPQVVGTYDEWNALPKDELKKYKWRDIDGDLWFINDQSGAFEVDGVADGINILEDAYFPLTRVKKIG